MNEMSLVEFGKKFLPNFKSPSKFQVELMKVMEENPNRKFSSVPPRTLLRAAREKVVWSWLLLHPPKNPIVFPNKERAEAFMKFARKYHGRD